MRMLTLDRITEQPGDTVLRASWVINLVVFLISALLFAAAVCVAIGIIPHGSLPATWLWCMAGLLFLWMAASFTALILGRRNKVWLVRSRGETLWIRCSGNPNGLALELTRDDLAWAQPMKLTYIFKGRGIGKQFEIYHYMDLGLSPQAAAVIDAYLRDEKIDQFIRQEFAPPVAVYKGWAWLDRPGVLRLYLTNITPTFARANKFFAKWTDVAPLRHETLANVGEPS